MKLTLLSLLLLLCNLLNGQFSEPKFGKIEESDLAMTKYEKDTTAGALILFDNGTSNFTLDPDKGFQFVYERHFQIKIFKKSAFDIGNFSARLYVGSRSKEALRNMKAVTYNLTDGKIVKTKLDNDNIYHTEGKNYTDLKFAFPEIKEGSVIELSYTIISDFLYNFRGWNFQYNYPARWSQYTYEIPEYFMYRESSKGYLPFDIQKKTRGFVSYSIPTVEVVSSGALEKHVAGQPIVIKAGSEKTILAAAEVPAFITEPDIDCEDNYLQSIEFELNSVEIPGQMIKNYTQTWEAVNTQMNEDEDFGQLLKTDNFIKDTVITICKNKTTDLEKAVSIYNYVQKRMKWNGDFRKWATKGLKKPYADGVGTSSEVNLILTLMLRTAGIVADPVLFSTRDNGIAVTFYPTVTKFNSVLSRAEIGGKVFLLDAVSKYCPFGVLPAIDINGRGRIVNNSGGDWANLSSGEKYNEVKNYTLSMNKDGNLTGLITCNYGGYAGIQHRNSLISAKSTDDYVIKLQEGMKGLIINKFTFSDKNDNYKPFSDTLSVELTDQAEVIGDKILFNPMLLEKIEKNRYTLENRKYPVDYNYPISEAYTLSYTIPEGYQVESLPQSVLLKLPDNSISISYNVQSTGNTIKMEYRRDISKILFLPEEYIQLKNLYDQMVKKHAEQVILKKRV